MTADSFKTECENAIAAPLNDTTLDPTEVGFVALTISEMREIHDVLRVAPEAAEQSRNESLRVQRLVERAKELEEAGNGLASRLRLWSCSNGDMLCREDAAYVRAWEALKGGAE